MVKGRERLGMLAGASLVVILASTLPVAYQSQELFGVENQTYWYEYDAVEWFSEHGVDSYTSDQRLGETGWRLFDIEYGRGLPYDLREGHRPERLLVLRPRGAVGHRRRPGVPVRDRRAVG